MMDAKLQPVWVLSGRHGRHLDQPERTDLQRQARAHLWWTGVVTNTGASTSGQVNIVDQSYRKVATIKAAAPWVISVHDAVISGGDHLGDRLPQRPRAGPHPLRRPGVGRRLRLRRPGVRHQDRQAALHVGRAESRRHAEHPAVRGRAARPAGGRPAGTPWDAYHINSIQLLARQRDARVDAQHLGRVPDQHQDQPEDLDAGRQGVELHVPATPASPGSTTCRCCPHNQVSLFNDNCCAITGPGMFAKPNGASGGLVLNLNTASHTASLASSYTHKNRRSTRRSWAA